jgi:hypothetical protein
MEPFGHVLPEDLPGLAATAYRNLTPGTEPSRATARMRKKDGTIVWMEITRVWFGIHPRARRQKPSSSCGTSRSASRWKTSSQGWR